MPGAGQLLGAGKARRAAADNRHRTATRGLRRAGLDPVLGEGAVNNRTLNQLNRDRGILQVQGAGRLAGRGADAPGEFGEIIGRMQALGGPPPVVAVDQIIPVRDQVVHRTAVLTIGDAAVEASRGLIAKPLPPRHHDKFVKMPQTLGHRLVGGGAAGELEKSGRLTHARLSSPGRHTARRGRGHSRPASV